MQRRAFLKSGLLALASYSLLGRVLAQVPRAKRPASLEAWLLQLHQQCKDLKAGTISPLAWQEALDTLYTTVPLAELLAALDFGKLAEGIPPADRGSSDKMVRLPQLEGLQGVQYYTKVLKLQRGRAIMPHGHENMASCHLVLGGEFRLRMYEKLEKSADALLVRASQDERIVVGSASSISDDRDNLHWFTCLSDVAYTFDVIVLGIDAAYQHPAGREYDTLFVDAEAASPQSDGSLLMPRLSIPQALAKYGKDVAHH